MKDAPRRGIRTLLWAILALAAAVPTSAAALGLTAEQTAKVGAICAIATAVTTAVVNTLEDAGHVPALLKAPASDGDQPVPDPVANFYLAGEINGAPIVWPAGENTTQA